ncbi:hypothetical protein M2253_001208 [Leucobacter luti]|nr:hypothetical protein [Leucobacter luti]
MIVATIPHCGVIAKHVLSRPGNEMRLACGNLLSAVRTAILLFRARS